MEEKNKYVETYITNIGEQLSRNGIKITENQLSKVINRFTNSEKSIEEIRKEINDLLDEFLENYSKMLEAKQLQDLDLAFNGITLNNQDIDLMLIAGANNPQELEEALSKITNIRLSLNTTELTEQQFVEVRQQVYDMYLDTLTSRNDYIKNRKIELGRKIEYLKSSGILSSEEIATLDNIISSSRSNDEIADKLNQSFSSDKVHRMYEIIRNFTPIEKTGIKSSTLEASRNLLEEIINNYNSITIDEEAKYGKVALQDGSFNFKHLQKALDFAKVHNKQVRLNTLLFYMDCPDELYNLEKTPENKMLVKQKLQNYVDATTRFIVDNGYSDTVRSVDVFNELLNRFAMTGETPYMYRGDIPQTSTTMPNGEIVVDDNIKSGWLKHLDIADLCDVIAVARKNMPTTDFMYNDDHLIDTKKIAPTIELINQIRENEKRLGVKLIDSIGTQMHVDNGMTKEQMREMIINLSQFGLPIEITEFDIAMTNGVEKLSEEQIETMRQSKINEIYECVDELREQYNIRGFTIWSKTDKQNFRVFLANEERIAKGLDPIETLHGGYYTEQMQPKNKNLTKSNFQSFNYHTHTFRSGHGEYCSDAEIVKTAKENGITTLGFSEHIPNPSLVLPDEDHRMLLSEVDEYISSINHLKSNNPDMTIISGFEAEFDPIQESFLGEMREKVDYMVLGQHFVANGLTKVQMKGNPNYPIEYASMISKAIDSGIFDIVAHPDIFMEIRDTMTDEHSKKLFDENSIIASQIICEKARDMGIPIEINFGGVNKNQILSDGNLSYPHPTFWKVASEIDGLKIIQGIDAHDLKAFEQVDEFSATISNITNLVQDKIITSEYNPVIARQNNPKLQEAYRSSQSNALTFETQMVNQMLSRISSQIPQDTDSFTTIMYMEQGLDITMQNCVDNASKKDEKIVDELSTIAESNKISIADKKGKIDRKKKVIEETNQVLANQQRTIETAKGTIKTAVDIGCETKEEISNISTQITEHNTTNDNEKKNTIEKSISNFQQSKGISNRHTEIKGQAYQLKRINNSNNGNNNNNSNHGFVNVLTLSLVVTFIIGVCVGIGYMLYKFTIAG